MCDSQNPQAPPESAGRQPARGEASYQAWHQKKPERPLAGLGQGTAFEREAQPRGVGRGRAPRPGPSPQAVSPFPWLPSQS